MAGKPDPYEGIDFEEISEATGLAVDEIKCLKVFIVDERQKLSLSHFAFAIALLSG